MVILVWVLVAGLGLVASALAFGVGAVGETVVVVDLAGLVALGRVGVVTCAVRVEVPGRCDLGC